MDSSDERIGNDTTEAFALLTLANNCKAWLCGGKLHHGDALWTEHDSDSGGRDSIVDELLVDQEFVLGEDTEATLVLCHTTKDSHKKAVKERKDGLAKFRRLPACAEMRGTWHLTTGDEEASENEPNCSRQDREKKRKRKHLKGLKKHTGEADEGERKFKGWSDNGHKAFVACAMSVKDDVTNGKHAAWERAFREVHAKQQEVRTGEGQPAAMKCAVSRSVVWEL
jgi:hypothetical protein